MFIHLDHSAVLKIAKQSMNELSMQKPSYKDKLDELFHILEAMRWDYQYNIDRSQERPNA